MIYLLLSVCLFSINNVLWAKYAQKVPTFVLIKNRAWFTTLFVGLIYVVAVGVYIPAETMKLLPQICLTSVVGFLGLYFLVLGFKYGTVLQFSVYSLLTAFAIGAVSQYQDMVTIQGHFVSLLLIVLGYLTFSYFQFYNSANSKNQLKAHAYFILAHSFFCVLLFLQWHFLQHCSSLELAFVQEVVVLVLSGILVYKTLGKNSPSQSLNWWQYLIFALPISLAVVLSLEGLKNTNPFYSSLTGLFTPLLTVVFGYFLTKEKFRPYAFLGFVIMLIGFSIFIYE